MHETSGTCRSKLSLYATFIKLLTYLKFEPVNTFMHNCDIFYIIIYANLCSYYVNQTCDEIEIGIVGKWKFSSFERCNFCFHTMYSLKDICV